MEDDTFTDEHRAHARRGDEVDPATATNDAQEARETSQQGAPTAGEAVSDIFSTEEIFERLLATADSEFSNPPRRLFLSGLAAGLIMSLSFMSVAAVESGLPDTASSRLVSSLIYPLSFVFIALGRYQLFTENTLTPVTLVLTRLASIPRLLCIWGLVFLSNVLGACMAGLFFAHTNVFEPQIAEAALTVSKHAMETSWDALFVRGIIAGWLVAGMVWLNHASQSTAARVLIVFVLIYPIAAANLAHCIVGASEGFYLVFRGEENLMHVLGGFLLPATLGNTLGGVLLVGILNYAEIDEEYHVRDRLSWKAWLFESKRLGRAEATDQNG